METNHQLELANNLLKYTGTHLFLTGKAGTGKTTFLHNLRGNSPKRMIITAPTGVAAINAGGVTLHSFFQLSFAPFVPGTVPTNEFFRFTKEKINIIRSLDLLVIDEISMVRADILDEVDYVLRHFRRNEQPFGGVQLLMIGDLGQLPPTVKGEEWNLLSNHYETKFFFGSLALKKTSYACVELKTVYRQSDEAFIKMLNQVRENKIDIALLQELNKRYQPNFDPDNEEGYIFLTTHNAPAQRMNSEKLAKINEKSYFYEAKITGNFPEKNYPTDVNLELKKGAQVMFVKNDTPTKRYYNGKIAVITYIDDYRIEAQGKDDPHPIVVEKAVWSNMKYTIDPETKELKEEEEGAFEQYPLKTAWAITVHKSQGLTFDKAIIDAKASFTHGQVYVALSRCRTLGGMVLSSPINAHSVIRNVEIDAFNHVAEEKEPDEQQFQNLRKDYFSKMFLEQFSYKGVQSRFNAMRRLLNEHFLLLYPHLIDQYKQAEERFLNEILNVSEQFQSQLHQFFSKTENPEEETFLQERIKKEAAYFQEKTRFLQDLANKTYVETDNQEVQKRANEILSLFQTEVRQKQKTLEICMDGFSVPAYLNAKSKAAIDERSLKKKKEKYKDSYKKSYTGSSTGSPTGSSTDSPIDSSTDSSPDSSADLSKDSPNTSSNGLLHPELYETIRLWRAGLAREQNVPAYVILSQVALIGIANSLPQDSNQLFQIYGVGKATLDHYGEDILQMVRQCVDRFGYEVKEFVVPNEKKRKKKSKAGKSAGESSENSSGEKSMSDTKKQTFLLFQQGKSIEEIAKERSLVVSTIEGHLVPYVQNGTIPLEKLVQPEKIDKIKEVLRQNPEAKLSEIKMILGEDYSYGEIRLVKEGKGADRSHYYEEEGNR